MDLEKFSYIRWLSWVSIRNAEILQQLLNVLSFARSENRSTSNNRDILMNFYKEVSNYSICNYDRKEDRNFFEIDYKFTMVIADVLSNCDQNLFDSIYNVARTKNIPYAELFIPNRKNPYSKDFVRKKICKYIREAGIDMSQEVVVRLLDTVQEATITTRKVAEIVGLLNWQLEGDGSSQENA